jgi:hypothetical protein
VRSSTELVFAILQVFKDDTPEDTKAVQPALSQIIFYPLSQFDGKMKSTDWSKLPSFPVPAGTAGGTKWDVPEAYFDQSPGVTKLGPPLPRRRSPLWLDQFRLQSRRQGPRDQVGLS